MTERHSQSRLALQEAGKQAFKDGRGAAECPYAFRSSPYWPNDCDGFDANYRWKLDAWMSGWIAAQKESR